MTGGERGRRDRSGRSAFCRFLLGRSGNCRTEFAVMPPLVVSFSTLFFFFANTLYPIHRRPFPPMVQAETSASFLSFSSPPLLHRNISLSQTSLQSVSRCLQLLCCWCRSRLDAAFSLFLSSRNSDADACQGGVLLTIYTSFYARWSFATPGR